jgi:precorrin-6A synthase
LTVEVLIIGIGSGDPAQLTREAVEALNRVDVFLVADKGAAKQDFVALRTELCRAVIDHDRYRIVEVPDPDRGPDRGRDTAGYRASVAGWHQARAELYAEVIGAEVGTYATVGFLAWGDPSLYDSTIRTVESVAELGIDLRLTVIPGISSLQLLAARHRIALNRVGEPSHITTGRRLVTEYSPSLGDVVVMLDGDLACSGLLAEHPQLTIFWGAQLGLADEALVTGRLEEVLEEIVNTRAAIRAARGWVMDTYLLRPPAPTSTTRIQ